MNCIRVKLNRRFKLFLLSFHVARTFMISLFVFFLGSDLVVGLFFVRLTAQRWKPRGDPLSLFSSLFLEKEGGKKMPIYQRRGRFYSTEGWEETVLCRIQRMFCLYWIQKCSNDPSKIGKQPKFSNFCTSLWLQTRTYRWNSLYVNQSSLTTGVVQK